MTFNGFISYSHAADGRLAPAVQHGLHRLAKPWHRRRALWIFRDQTGLSVTPGLWSSIQTALDGSEYFVLLASPEAARSQWVNREIEHWIATKSANQILPVVTDGEWAWDPEKRDFTAESTAVPAALRGVFAEEPLFLDLRWARGTEHLSLQHSRFRDAIAQLAAPMHGVSKDELEGEDVRQHRRARRLRSGAAATLVVLTVLAAGAGMSAVRNAERARTAAEEALRQQQLAAEQRGTAQRFALESRQQQELAQQQQALATDAAAEADRSERLAQQRQTIADQAETEARRQQRIADKAAAEARRQQKLADQAAKRTREQQQRAKEATAQAKEATARAQEATARAQREQREAQRLAKVADVQRRLAQEAAAEAKRQRAKADQQQRIAVSRRLINQARASVDAEPKMALMLGAAAQRIQPDAEIRTELAGVVTATNYAGALADVTSAVYAPDGVLAAHGSDGVVSFWNVADRRNPVRIASLPERTEGSLTFSRDGRTMAVLGAGDTVVLWNLADRSHPVRLGALPGGAKAYAVATSADGATFVTAAANGDVTVWDRTDPARPTRLAVINYPVVGGLPPMLPRQLTISPDGSVLIVDLGTRVEVYDLTEPTDPVRVRKWGSELSGVSMAFSPDGSTLAVGSRRGTVGIFETERLTEPLPPPPPPPVPPAPGEPPRPVPPPWPDFEDDPFEFGEARDGLAGEVTALAFSADGRLLAAGDASGTALVWDNLTRLTSMRTFGRINTLSFDPKGETLVSADSSARTTLWNLPPLGTPDRLAALDLPGGTVRAIAFRPDGRALLAAGSGGTAKSWNVADPAHPGRPADLTIHPGTVRAVAFSPDRKTVAAVGSQDGQLTLTDLTRPARPVTSTSRDERLRGTVTMEFSPDGRTLAVVGSTGLLLWNVADRARPALLGTLGRENGLGWVIAFSPDGRVLANGNGRTVTLWNVADRSAPVRLAGLSGHREDVTALAFSPNGRTLVSGSADATAMLWDVTDRVGPQRVATLIGHGGALASVAFSADGRTLATGSTSDVVTVWDTANPAGPFRLATMSSGLDSSASAVEFGRDGRTLAVVSQFSGKATIRLWSYTTLNKLRANPIEYVCDMTGRGLTAREWARSIPELPYQRTCAG